MLNKKQTSLTIKIFAVLIALSFVISFIPGLGLFTSQSPSAPQTPQTGSTVQPVKPTSPAARVASAIGQGDARLAAKDYAGAITFYQQAVAADDSSSAAHGKLGAAYFLAGDPKARAALDRSVDLDAQSADPRYYRGRLAQAAGDRAAAKSDFETYLKLMPSGPYAAEVRQVLKQL